MSVDADLLLRIVLGVLAAWAVLVAGLWVFRPRDVALSELVAFVPDLVRLVRSLVGGRAVPLAGRGALGFLLVRLVSPVDPLPRFIPLLRPPPAVVVAGIGVR